MVLPRARRPRRLERKGEGGVWGFGSFGGNRFFEVGFRRGKGDLGGNVGCSLVLVPSWYVYLSMMCVLSTKFELENGSFSLIRTYRSRQNLL